ncbi:competence type IV pilus assembly protein ComGB [Pontibacillus litoralis]|uniref:Type II secretion system protein GspF domain-containing protein n=1 Tax=Pontibacillus litoralis JSM 072002 TaxID=1385512 RepID=A0A0A5HZZ7_9BACI|nr:competence type IV pilus assembly protein ComGB [Pontibacillus litoralis]KGX89182.1 hypothetical protein N784_00515 [Pontibacillus litoralis JSM 072002]
MHLASSIKQHFKTVRSSTISVDRQILLLQRLSHLLRRGYSLVDALHILHYDPKLQSITFTLKEKLLAGLPLHSAMEQLHFSKYVISYLQFSNSYGNLEEALRQSSILLEKQLTFKQRVQKSLQYPAVLLFIMVALLIFVKSLLLPSFIDLFHSIDIGDNSLLPILSGINIILYTLLFTILFITLAAITWKYVSPHLSLHTRLDLYERIPFCSTFIQLQTTFMFSYHLSTLLATGLSIQKSLRIIQMQNHFPILQWYATSLEEQLLEGKPLHTLIYQYPFFKQDLASIFERNQSEGRLELDLEMYAQWMMEESQHKLYSFIKWIQPTMFAFLALLIMAIYGSIMMPLFQWMNQL